jgi:Flp pilus assembly protein protease CpaA
MNNIVFYILSIPFLYFNYKIIVSDLKYKKIPNKYLGYLLLLIPFWWILIFLVPVPIIGTGTYDVLLFFSQIIITFIISFILYYFWIWAAWDAKYLLVLSLFIPYIWIIPFIWNIALVTLAYLFWYFIYFYFYKIAFNKQYRQSLWWNIQQDLNERWKVYKQNKWWNTYKIIFKWLIIFLLFFVSIRLVRLYLLKWFFSPHLASPNGRGTLIFEIIEKYNIYLFFLFLWLFIWWLILFRLWINKLKKYVSEKFKINLNTIGNVLLLFLSIFLISFITYEYFKNPYEIKKYLFKIFTIYLILYIIFKILKAAYKITFWIAEYQYIDVKDLKEGDIVDKEYLIRMLGKQVWLWYITEKNKKYKKSKKYLLYPSPTNYFKNIDNPIDKETLKILQKGYFITNKYHLKYTTNFPVNNTIKILNTFSFAPYILAWFLLTFFFQDKIFKNILNFWTDIIKQFIQK